MQINNNSSQSPKTSKGYRRIAGSPENLYQIVHYQKNYSPIKGTFHRPNTCEDESESPRQFKMIDITKLPTGQFKDTRYLWTDDTFFKKLLGNKRNPLLAKAVYQSQQRSNSYKERNYSQFSQHLLKLAVKNKVGDHPQSLQSSMLSMRSSKTLKIINMTPTPNYDPPKTPKYSSARQKLFNVLLHKN